jgi:hypothetical protein
LGWRKKTEEADTGTCFIFLESLSFFFINKSAQAGSSTVVQYNIIPHSASYRGHHEVGLGAITNAYFILIYYLVSKLQASEVKKKTSTCSTVLILTFRIEFGGPLGRHDFAALDFFHCNILELVSKKNLGAIHTT